MNLLNLLPWWAKLAILAALLAAAAWAVHAYNESLREDGREEVRTEWAKAREVQAAAALAESQKNAAETQRRLAAQQKAQETHDLEIAQARRDAAGAAVAGAGLRRQLAAFAAAASRTPSDPAAVGVSPPAGTPINVLADLFLGADSTAGILAEALDRSYAAGNQCAREHDSLTVKP